MSAPSADDGTKSVAVQHFFHKGSNTLQYVIAERVPSAAGAKRKCVVLDSVWDYDQASSKLDTSAADELLAYVREQELECELVLDTHAHADHLSAAQYIKRSLGGAMPYAIGEHVLAVQSNFKPIYNFDWLVADGSQFDRLLKHDEHVRVGALDIRVLSTPGHTPSCSTYVFNNECAFVGDTLFAPDGGSARCDFPGGDAKLMWQSLQSILSLPPDTVLFLCHDYMPGGRELEYRHTVQDHLDRNKHCKAGTTEEVYVKTRTERDAVLNAPRLLLPSIQVNINGARLPPAEANGTSYLKMPVRDPTRSAGAAASSAAAATPSSK